MQDPSVYGSTHMQAPHVHSIFYILAGAWRHTSICGNHLGGEGNIHEKVIYRLTHAFMCMHGQVHAHESKMDTQTNTHTQMCCGVEHYTQKNVFIHFSRSKIVSSKLSQSPNVMFLFAVIPLQVCEGNRAFSVPFHSTDSFRLLFSHTKNSPFSGS